MEAELTPRESVDEATSLRVPLLVASSAAYSGMADADPTVDLMSADETKDLDRLLFDSRWALAQQHCGGDRERALRMLQSGAQSMGFWKLDTATLAPLCDVLVGEAAGRDGNDNKQHTGLASPAAGVGESHGSSRNYNNLVIALALFTVLGSIAKFLTWILIEAFSSYWTDLKSLFGWPIIGARVAALAVMGGTSLLFLTMSRHLLTWCRRRSTSPYVLWVADNHRVIHVISAGVVVALAAAHTVFHGLGDYPRLVSADGPQLERALQCRKCDDRPLCRVLLPRGLAFPRCPLLNDDDKVVVTVDDAVLSMPTLTGLLLWVVMLLLTYLSRSKQRQRHFNRFLYCHQVLVALFMLLLWLHASNQWLGMGFPMVLLVCGVPCLIFAVERCWRCRAFYSSRSAFRIKNAVFKSSSLTADADASAKDGELMRLSLECDEQFRSAFVAGMYAFVHAPEISVYEAHPYTICSGETSNTIDFIVAVNGDWSRRLVQRCKSVAQGSGGAFPAISLDGPFTAPTQAALHRRVVMAVGAGVGITPFLSLLETISGTEECVLEEGHFVWVTRTADDFLLAWPVLRKVIDGGMAARIVFHLHVTARAGGRDGAGLVFREAVTRTSPPGRPQLKLADLDLVIKFGRPQWRRLFASVGDKFPDEKIAVYSCGNLGVVQHVERACEAESRHRSKDAQFECFHEDFD